MVRHINDHVPSGAAVSMSGQQLQRLEAVLIEALEPVRQVVAAIAEDKSRPPTPAVFSSEQFDELKAVLQPGFELSSLMLADYKAQRASAMADHSGDKPNAVVVAEPFEDIVQPQPGSPSGLE